MNLLPHFLRALLATASCIILSGCLIQYSNPIKADTKVDPRLEGVWVLQEMLPEDVRNEGDESDIGVQGYLIFAKVDDGTYKVMAIDSFEKEEENVLLEEMLVSSRKYQQHTFLTVRLPQHEREKIQKESGGKDETSLNYLLLDYEIDSKGQLFLRFLGMDNFDEVPKVHPVNFDKPKGLGFVPVTMTGSEEEILKLYSDPKVRALFTSCGKYRKLQLPAE